MKKLNKRILKWIVLAGIMFSAAGTIVTINHTVPVSATSITTKYGRGAQFIVPSSMRGTWVARSKNSAFKKIKLTAHTATLTPQASLYKSKKYSGKWSLYHINEEWYSKYFLNHPTSRAIKASKYSIKHHWLSTRKGNSIQLFFKYGWATDDEHSFMLRKTNSKNALKFLNPSFQNKYYRK